MAERLPVAEVTQNGERCERPASSREARDPCVPISAFGLMPALLAGALFSKMIDEVFVHIKDLDVSENNVSVKNEDKNFGTKLLSSLEDLLIALLSTHIGIALGYGAYRFLLLIKEKETKVKAGAAPAAVLGITACGATMGDIYKWMIPFLFVWVFFVLVFLYKRVINQKHILKYFLLLIFTVLWYVVTTLSTVYAAINVPVVAVLSTQLLEVVSGHLVYFKAGDEAGAGAGKVCAGAVAVGGAVLLAIQNASPIFSTRAKLGGLLGVSAASGVALSAAGALSLRYGEELKCKCGVICGSTAAIVGAAAGAFLTSRTLDTRLEIFKSMCAGVIPGMMLAESIFKYVWKKTLEATKSFYRQHVL